jgi:hypothetical protein
MEDNIKIVYLDCYRAKDLCVPGLNEHDDYSLPTPEEKWNLNGKHSCS